MIMIGLMERFGRSYEEYMNTPQRIIDLIIEKKEIDSKLSNK